MKPLLCLSLSLLLLAGYSCTHPATSLPSPRHEKSVIDTIAGRHIWHGTDLFDGGTHIISNDTITIIKVNDSTITFSPLYSFLRPLTYVKTDSINKFVMFNFQGIPLTLYYFYTTDSLHYIGNIGGIHNEQANIYTP